MALLETEHLSFRYALGTADALDDVSLSVEPGEFVLLCGPSGGGKSTLLRHFKPELWPAGARRGQVCYGGQPIKTIARRRSAAELGLVLQNPESQIVTDAVWHEMAFGLENLGTPPAQMRRRVAETASFFGIGHWFRRKTSELSGGQKQLLNLAAVLTLTPRVLLLDEPFSMLDPMAARSFADTLGRLNRELGLTIVCASHRVEDVFHLAGRVAFLERGRLLCCLPPRALGSFLRGHAGAWAFLPAPMRLAHALGAPDDALPLTVREGRDDLRRRVPAAARQAAQAAAEKSGKNAGVKTPPLLACRRVSFAFEKGAPRVLRDVSLALCAGEHVCLMGGNGAGKSTLLRLLAGLAKPLGGEVLLHGRPMSRLSAAEKWRGGIALLPQETRALFTGHTLREEYETAADPARAGAMARQMGLEAYLDTHPFDLSGGETQRAAIGLLLLTAPAVLLLDEPTHGLDAPARGALAALLAAFCAQGGAVLTVTHDMDFAAAHAARCLLLFDGEIVCDEPPRAFFAGNEYYTTAVGRMARGILPGAVTCEDVERLCEKKD